MLYGLTLFVSWGIKNTAASLDLRSTSVATRKSTSKLGSSLAAPSVACLQEKPYMNVGARLPSIARTLEYNVSGCVCVCVFNELFGISKQFALNNVITSIFLIVEISCQLNCRSVNYTNFSRYSVAVITGSFEAVKSFPLRVIMTSALAFKAV